MQRWIKFTLNVTTNFGQSPPFLSDFPKTVNLTGVPPILEVVFEGYWENIVFAITPSLLNKIWGKNSQFWVFSRFKEVWHRFQVEQRSSSAVLASGKIKAIMEKAMYWAFFIYFM